MHAVAAGVLPCAIDFGGLVDAVWVDSGATLGFYNITIRNTGPRSITRLDNRARYKAMYFAPWPSIVLSPGAQVPRDAPPQDASLLPASSRCASLLVGRVCRRWGGWVPRRSSCMLVQHS